MEQTVDYSRKWFVMAAVAMGIFLGTIDTSIVNVALPTLVREFHTEFPVVQWVVLVYLLIITTLMLSVGRLADMVGKKPLYTIGFGIFTLGSVLCGLSPSIHWLIGFRVLQAVGATMATGLGLAILTESFPPAERGRAMGIGGTVVSIGVVLGPTLGGILIDALSWHWIFFVNLPIGIVGILMVIKFVPNFKPAGGQRFDYVGAVLMFASLLCLLLALTIGQSIGFGDVHILALFVASVCSMGGFIWYERRVSQPMIDFSMFGNRLFSVNLVTGFMTFVALAGILMLMPFYLEGVLGYQTRQVGLLMAAVPLAMGTIAPIAGMASDRFGARPITVLGLFIMVIGFSAVASLGLETTTFGYMIRFAPIGLGMGIFQSPNNSAIMGSVPRERLGIASSLLSLTRTFGNTVGVATLGAVWTTRVASYADGGPLAGGASTAAPWMQVAGLRDTFVIVVIWIAMGLALSAWGLIHERRRLALNRARLP